MTTTTEIPMGPSTTGTFQYASSIIDMVSRIDVALRGVELGKGDDVFAHQALWREPIVGMHVTVLIERARAAERLAVLAEVAPEEAVKELAEQVREEERTRVQADADRRLAAEQEQWRAVARAERQELQRAWGVVASALSTPE